jgi:hypothetical protein
MLGRLGFVRHIGGDRPTVKDIQLDRRVLDCYSASRAASISASTTSPLGMLRMVASWSPQFSFSQ